MNKLSTLAVAALVFASAGSQAATIAAWTMAGQPGDQLAMAGATATGVSSAVLSRGGGLGATSGGDSFSSNGWGGADTGDYLSFTLEIDPDYLASLDGLELTTRASNTGPGTLGLYTSLDGFLAPLATLVQPGSTALDSFVDLSGLGPVSGSIEFRLLEIGDTQADGVGATSNSGTLRLLDGSGGPVQFSGDLSLQAVPLPASLWLFSSALAALGCRGRRGLTTTS